MLSCPDSPVWQLRCGKRILGGFSANAHHLLMTCETEELYSQGMSYLSKMESNQTLIATWKVTVGVLAVIGLLWLIGGPIMRAALSPLFETKIVRSEPSPDRVAIAEVQVRRGGLGTVWTTRVHLRPNLDGDDYWTVYQAKDSDFVPSMWWADRETLIIGLPCERFDYVSNPDDWERSDPSERRLKVRFTYEKGCSPSLN
jgi:hypothetical protein